MSPGSAYTRLPMRCTSVLLFSALLALPAVPAWAQNTVIQVENVRMEYAQVLHVEPVYQTLRASTMVQRCEASTPATPPTEPERKGLSRVVGVVKDALTPAKDASKPLAAEPTGNCRMVPMDREFRRPIAYDVDYVHKGVKYRSRLPYDPGNRLRVRVSVTPYVPPAGSR